MFLKKKEWLVPYQNSKEKKTAPNLSQDNSTKQPKKKNKELLVLSQKRGKKQEGFLKKIKNGWYHLKIKEKKPAPSLSKDNSAKQAKRSLKKIKNG